MALSSKSNGLTMTQGILFIFSDIVEIKKSISFKSLFSFSKSSIDDIFTTLILLDLLFNFVARSLEVPIPDGHTTSTL